MYYKLKKNWYMTSVQKTMEETGLLKELCVCVCVCVSLYEDNN
jgi:hypothetical protein